MFINDIVTCSHTIVTKPIATSLRTFIIVTKITQSCVNQPAKPFQETHMLPFTDFAFSYYPKVTELLSSVSNNPVNPQTPLVHEIRPSLLFATVPTLIESFSAFAKGSTEKFANFCETIQRRGHHQLLQQFLELIDDDKHTVHQALNVVPTTCPGVVYDIQDEQLIDNLTHSFDDIIDQYQSDTLHKREEIIRLQNCVRKKRNVITTRTTQLDTVHTININTQPDVWHVTSKTH